MLTSKPNRGVSSPSVRQRDVTMIIRRSPLDYETMSDEELHQLLKERLTDQHLHKVDGFNRATVIAFLKISEEVTDTPWHLSIEGVKPDS